MLVLTHQIQIPDTGSTSFALCNLFKIKGFKFLPASLTASTKGRFEAGATAGQFGCLFSLHFRCQDLAQSLTKPGLSPSVNL